MTTAAVLRNRVTIQQPSASRGKLGGVKEGWADVGTVWAAVAPISGREFFAAQQVNSEVTHRVTIRYLPGVDAKMRVIYGKRVLEIQSVIDPQERHVELQLMCVERPDSDAG